MPLLAFASSASKQTRVTCLPARGSLHHTHLYPVFHMIIYTHAVRTASLL
jgi:hypothetical protein